MGEVGRVCVADTVRNLRYLPFAFGQQLASHFHATVAQVVQHRPAERLFEGAAQRGLPHTQHACQLRAGRWPGEIIFEQLPGFVCQIALGTGLALGAGLLAAQVRCQFHQYC